MSGFYAVFWDNPLKSITFFALMMSLVSFWLHRSIWLWGSFLFISYALACHTGVAELVTLLPIGLLLATQILLKRRFKGASRLFLFLLAASLSGCLSFHLIPGFHNWQITYNLALSQDALPINFFLNFDKPFMGLFILACGLPLISSRAELIKVLKATLPFLLLVILLLFVLSVPTGILKWEPKLPTISLIWLLTNLIFVTIPEEVFWRGFIQKEFFSWLGGKGAFAHIGCVVLTSLIFTLFHVLWVFNLPFLSLVFLASVIYGTLFQYTRAIESSIFCHFALNCVHFFFFTYPALK